MQNIFALLPIYLLAICFFYSAFKTFKRYLFRRKYMLKNAVEIDESSINGSDCLIVGNHPFAHLYGKVVGSKEVNGRWALVIKLKDQPEIYCYVFENKNLQFL